jgi:23S rRNA pseudouridine1911/1915/1917 synthase
VKHEHQQGGKRYAFDIEPQNHNCRLDVFLSATDIGFSRSRIQAVIRSRTVLINGSPSKSSYKLKTGDKVSVTISPPKTATALEPLDIDFKIIYEDHSLVVINKPAGVVVHPAPGHATDTLVHGLLLRCNDLSGIGGVLRPGIVHRLDKDTSGIMVVAKNDRAHVSLSQQFKSREITKAYIAVVHGRVKGNKGKIDLPIARHPLNRKKMAVSFSGDKQAVTLWEKTKEFEQDFSLLSVFPKTGRTHQIRVHLSHIGHPIVGDEVYGHGLRWWKRQPLYQDLKGDLTFINRQMLHAKTIGFMHPDQGKRLNFEAPIPDDMTNVIRVLMAV